MTKGGAGTPMGQEYTRDKMYSDLEEINEFVIMNLPGALRRRAFSLFGGQANKKFKKAVETLTEKYKEKQTIDTYVKVQTNKLQTKISELEEKNLGLAKIMDDIAKQIPKGSKLGTLSDEDLKYESLGREKAKGYSTEDLKTQTSQ